jgi:hypothetical protein
MPRGKIKRKVPVDNSSFLIEAECMRLEKGYRWEECETYAPANRTPPYPEPPFLTPNAVPVPGVSHHDWLIQAQPRFYNPLKNTTLFAAFADLEASKDSFAKWAGKYGLLLQGGEVLEYNGRRYFLTVLPKREAQKLKDREKLKAMGGIELDNGYISFPIASESFSFWRKEHYDFSLATRLWETISNGDTETLEKMVSLEDGRSIHIWDIPKNQARTLDRVLLQTNEEYRRKNGVSLFGSYPARDMSAISRKLFDSHLFRANEFEIHLAYDFLFQFINYKLHLYPLQLRIGVLNDNPFDTEPGELDSSTRYPFVAQPTSFLSCLYWQLAQATMGKICLRRCEVCGKWEDMATHRVDWTQHSTCANAKRVQRHREKQQQEIPTPVMA